VLSFSWGVTKPADVATIGGGVAGKAAFQDLSIVHKIDKASPLLLEACATGAHLKEATITHRKAGKDHLEYLIVKMADVNVTGVVHGGQSGEAASETISLVFAKVDFEYRPQKPMGPWTRGFISSSTSKRTKTARVESRPETGRRTRLGSSWSRQNYRRVS
jgi:type VI secretion system secreted protein Hcp